MSHRFTRGWLDLGLDMRKPDFVAWEHQRRRSDCPSVQSDQCLCYSLSAWVKVSRFIPEFRILRLSFHRKFWPFKWFKSLI